MQAINQSTKRPSTTNLLGHPLEESIRQNPARDAERSRVRASILETLLPNLDSEAPIEFQRALFLGSWRLFEHFEIEGMRYFVFEANARREPLTPRECAILERAAAGESDWTAAGALNCSPSTVAIHRQRAMAKIGIFSRALLSQVLALSGRASDPSHANAPISSLCGGPFDIDGRTLFVLGSPSLRGRLPTVLTASERAVAALLLEGLSNRDVATLRGTSVRTVANQVSAILRKLRIGSRTEIGPLLFSTLARPAASVEPTS